MRTKDEEQKFLPLHCTVPTAPTDRAAGRHTFCSITRGKEGEAERLASRADRGGNKLRNGRASGGYYIIFSSNAT
jgi:hypothetical protein